MGSIKKTNGAITVTFTTDDLLNQPAWVKFPCPPEEGMVWADYIGNFIIRAAWHLIKTRAPQFVEEVNETDVNGKGAITVTFRRRKE